MNTLPLGTKIFSALFALLIITSAAQAAPIEDLPNFWRVNANVYRGGRPTKAGYKTLLDKKIKTVINLEDSASAIKTEQKYLAGSGVKIVSIPFNSFKTPNDQDVKAVQDLLNDSSNFPVYIHCQHGKDRTGLMIGLYNFEHGWSAADAYQDMLEMGFSRILFKLKNYYKEKTGL